MSGWSRSVATLTGFAVRAAQCGHAVEGGVSSGEGSPLSFGTPSIYAKLWPAAAENIVSELQQRFAQQARLNPAHRQFLTGREQSQVRSSRHRGDSSD